MLMRKGRYKLPVAVHLLLLKDEHILLHRRANTGYEDGNYSVVAGHLDGNEEVKQAMIREAREEAMIEIAHEHLHVVSVMHRHFKNGEAINFFLTANQWTGTIGNGEPHKCSELAWYPLKHLPTNMVPYVRRAIENYQQGTWFDSFGWPGNTAT